MGEVSLEIYIYQNLKYIYPFMHIWAFTTFLYEVWK